MQHWLDKIAAELSKLSKEHLVFEAGISVSGLQHIGRLRGETLLPAKVKQILEREYGKKVTQYLTLWSQDNWKGKSAQLKQFHNPEEAKQYIGWRYIDVPDPKGCHKNWYEHFKEPFIASLPEFGIYVQPISTTEFYAMEETRKLIEFFIKNKDKVRAVLNIYRKRRPYTEGWIPFNPLCTNCKRIDCTDALSYDSKKAMFEYVCRDCGHRDWSALKDGKLDWRLEWVALWNILKVDFEPYGKDHMTPGGSRDSCVHLAKELKLSWPTGFGYEWVYWKRDGKLIGGMSSSDFIGIGPKELLQICDPEIFAYIMVSTRPLSEIYYDPAEVNLHYEHYDQAERVYYGTETPSSERDKFHISRSFELAQIQQPPSAQPYQLSFNFAALLAQIFPDPEHAIARLKELGHIKEPTKFELARIKSRLARAKSWVKRWAPEQFKLAVQEHVSDEVRTKLSDSQRAALVKLADELQKDWTEDKLATRLYELAREHDLKSSQFFKAAYTVILSRPSGPRLAQLILTIGKDKIAKLLSEL